MIYKNTNGSNPDFIELCRLLDDYLNELAGGEENRSQYIQYNTLQAIHDVVIAYDNDIPAGCAGFKRYNADTAEVKRVFVKKKYRGQGIAKQLINSLEIRAKEKGYGKLVLETGRQLTEANGLYKKIGFMTIPNYGQHKDMPGSICMEKLI
jgi:putative acetyltransferase